MTRTELLRELQAVLHRVLPVEHMAYPLTPDDIDDLWLDFEDVLDKAAENPH